MASTISLVNLLSSSLRNLTYSSKTGNFFLRSSVGRILGRYITCSHINNKVFQVNNNNDFVEKVMNSDVPVIVNFHADWCDPCHILSPKLKELIEPFTDLNLAIIDVEKNPELVHTFEVKAVPAVIAVRNGLVVDKFIGLVDADMIENLVNKLVGKPKENL